MSETLPIEAVLPRIVEAAGRHLGVVVRAEPGAGKTTRIPPAVLGAGLAGSGEIWVVQPRRLAARMAAARIASEAGEAVGGSIGYTVRFDDVSSARTRIRLVTDGILMQRLRRDPVLAGIGAVIFDEFHERRLECELALALCRVLQGRTRPDLRLVVMSATLAADDVAARLGWPAVEASGRSFPIEIEHAARASDRTLASQVAAAVRGLLEGGLEGHVLVFLPGAREIREAEAACRGLAERGDLRILPLHGELPVAAQDAAVGPSRQRKLVLATNVAETSVTIPDVVAVVDSGLHRLAAHDPWTGFSTLKLAPIAQASAVQRAGRAGRTAPGRCIRLFTRADFERRPAADPPEIRRLDLSAMLLDLHAQGLSDPATVPFLEPPPMASIGAARELLARLGAIEGDRLGEIGREMLDLPLPPRLARLVVEARKSGVPRLGAGVAALLGERSPRRGRGRERATFALADVLVDLDLWERWQAEGSDDRAAERLDLDPGACRQIARVRRQLMASKARDTAPRPDEALCRSLLVAFPERVARVRRESGGGRSLALACNAGTATLAAESVVGDADLVLALAVEERRDQGGKPRTMVASAAVVELEWLIDAFADRLEETRRARFDPERERVEVVAEVRYEGLLVDGTPLGSPSAEASAELLRAVLERGVGSILDDPDAFARLRSRLAFVGRHRPGFPTLDDGTLTAILERLCAGRRSFAELRRADPLGEFRASLPAEAVAELERLAPSHVQLGHRRAPIQYPPDGDPFVAARIQDFFAVARPPTVLSGRVPLLLHLLAPNGRAVQVTRDLERFWTEHYPDLRRSLSRRYPRHAWPENPRGEPQASSVPAKKPRR